MSADQIRPLGLGALYTRGERTWPVSPWTYGVQGRWTENGKEVTQTQKVEVGAGTHSQVDFPIPSKAAGQTAATPKS